MKIKSALKICRNAKEVQTEVRRISETCFTHPPKEKLRCSPLRKQVERKVKVFRPWLSRRDWQLD